jgi:hypothetical protein
MVFPFIQYPPFTSNKGRPSAHTTGEALNRILDIFSEELKNCCQRRVSWLGFRDTYLSKLTVCFKINILSLFQIKIISS